MTSRDKPYSPWIPRGYFFCCVLLLLLAVLALVAGSTATYQIIGGIYALVGVVAVGLGLRWRRR